MTDREEIRKKKIQELKEQAEEDTEEDTAAQDVALFDAGARRRLNSVEMAYPERAKKTRNALREFVQSGRLDAPVTEEQVKEVLKKVSSNKQTDFDISRR